MKNVTFYRLRSSDPLAALLCVTALFACLGVASAKSEDKERWDSKYSSDAYLFGKDPISFLTQNVHLLPQGKALDVAMGEGRNGVFLATKGFQVTGIDISEKGLQKAKTLAAERGVTITTQIVDLEQVQLEKSAYDVVLCTYYLQRSLFPQIKEALKSGGMVVVETYTMEHLKYRPDFRKEYLIQANELLELFKEFKILRYQLEDTGKAAYASIIAQKP
ncbi:MAG: class I SAM-dependent methyltransferase [Nitrospiraceae bacterium]